MSNQNVVRAAYYLRISTEEQELDNQRGEIIPFIERRGWKLIHPFEDVMSGRKTEKDRPGFAAMLKAAHQRKFDIVVFWALDRLTRESQRFNRTTWHDVRRTSGDDAPGATLVIRFVIRVRRS
jgi:DNA invertase Pin-like site-specific DNA recombinase